MIIRECFGLRKTNGQIGLEIETEGATGGFDQLDSDVWRLDRDGSLRGGGIELTLRKPLSRNGVLKAVQSVQELVDNRAVEIEDSGRAGVHVHLNMQERTIAQVYNVVCAYLIFEDVLTEWCGSHRVGNFFCLRTRDAEGLLDTIVSSLQSQSYTDVRTDDIRYAGLNLTSLSRYGSLEFRAMRSTTDPDTIMTWIDVLLKLHDWALGFESPDHLVQMFSERGPQACFDEVFGEFRDFPYDEDSFYEGVRQAQMIAYCVEDWNIDPYTEFLELASKNNLESIGWDTDGIEQMKNKRNFYNNSGPRYVKRLKEYLAQSDDSGLQPETGRQRRRRREAVTGRGEMPGNPVDLGSIANDGTVPAASRYPVGSIMRYQGRYYKIARSMHGNKRWTSLSRERYHIIRNEILMRTTRGQEHVPEEAVTERAEPQPENPVNRNVDDAIRAMREIEQRLQANTVVVDEAQDVGRYQFHGWNPTTGTQRNGGTGGI